MKSVMAKLAEVNKSIELASHKINLGAAEDLAKAKGDMQAMISQLNAELVKLKAADDAIGKAKVEADKIVKAAQIAADKVNAASEKLIASSNKTLLKFGTSLDKIDKQAKDLGISPNQIPGYSEVDKMYQQVEDAISALNGYSFVNE